LRLSRSDAVAAFPAHCLEQCVEWDLNGLPIDHAPTDIHAILEGFCDSASAPETGHDPVEQPSTRRVGS